MTIDSSSPSRQLRTSWDDNASAWTAAVREGRIPSRRAGTDAAIIAACQPYEARRILDVGCGEGWLARTLAAPGRDVLGVDGSAGLIEAANALALDDESDSDSAGPVRFEVAGYETIAANDDVARGPFDLVVCNFALLDQDLVPLLRALARRLSPGGTLLVQTVHSWMAMGDAPYRSGWREETFATFDVPFPTPMPWYYRTLGAWTESLRDAGLAVRMIEEPLHPETGRPLSMLLHCKHV
ncbi:MAG TPA: class I SAM-dependent methyltransferase [Gemmatimonas sp.]|nr:class I SAM-dependent methyltransferase [Gemmatimonas sp.]